MLLVMGLQAVTVPPDSQTSTQVDPVGIQLVSSRDYSVALHASHVNLPSDDSVMDDDDGSDSSTDFNFGSLVTDAAMLALPLHASGLAHAGELAQESRGFDQPPDRPPTFVA
jgi:hypothetical protein